MRTDDPVKDFLRHDSEMQKKLDRRPVCYECGEPIQDETAVYFMNNWICNRCIEDMTRWIPDD